MHLDITLGQILLAGAIAGGTIFLGLPIAFIKASARLRTFLNALAVGVLLFLFVEIAYQGVERIESYLKLSIIGHASLADMFRSLAWFVGGFVVALWGLVWFERRWIKTSPQVPGTTSQLSPHRLAFMIALGIGLHNFGEGLIMGQAFAGGHYSLGLLLVVGFALHNGSEGFGIAAPLAGSRPSIAFLALMGVIGGGPTLLGTYIGSLWVQESLEILFMGLAAGSILYIIGELIHLGRLKGSHAVMTGGLLVGFFIAFASDLFIEYAVSRGLEEQVGQRVIEMEAGEYFFEPKHIEIKQGEAVKLLVTNTGEAEHEIEIIGRGILMEQVLPVGRSLPIYLQPRYSGVIPFICDMPGHLGGGMHGTITVN